MKYMACGNIMSDMVEDAHGVRGPLHIGGPAFFALTALRLWTKDCKLVCQAGADYDATYGSWMDLHGLSRESIRVEADHCTVHVLKYNEDGSYGHQSIYGSQNLGYLKTTPEHIEAAASDDTVGFYLAQNQDKVFWKKLEEVKNKKNLKMMWELEVPKPGDNLGDKLQRIKDVIHIADMWSLNSNEASYIFDIPKENDEDIINEIMKLPVEMTLYRVGKRGAYAVTPSTAVFCESIDVTESIDPTGCGNSSTGAAMWAHLEGLDPAMVVVVANLTAGYNVAQVGPIPYISDEIMEDARRRAVEYYKKITGKEFVK
ncbi:MAG: carbohydrate kinase family protein [Ruminococcaceae bacterium]|mgnify:CR=1 FL=1|nr:carbohydrate kinase family protein [Oscillospiraceae bacterium]